MSSSGAQRGVELGSAPITSTSAVVPGSTFTAITGLSVTVTTGARPVVVDLVVSQLLNSTATASALDVAIFEDGVQVAMSTVSAATQFSGAGVVVRARRAPTPGSHTYSVRIRAQNAAAGAYISAAVNAPAILSAIEV